MIVVTKKGKTLLDKGVDWKRKPKRDIAWVSVKLMKEYELLFTHSEWKHITKK